MQGDGYTAVRILISALIICGDGSINQKTMGVSMELRA
jgi:hypothetical protein